MLYNSTFKVSVVCYIERIHFDVGFHIRLEKIALAEKSARESYRTRDYLVFFPKIFNKHNYSGVAPVQNYGKPYFYVWNNDFINYSKGVYECRHYCVEQLVLSMRTKNFPLPVHSIMNFPRPIPQITHAIGCSS